MRIQIRLTDETWEKVKDWAHQDHRPPREHLEFLIAQAVADRRVKQVVPAEVANAR
jgi:hypothetical protein